MANILVFDNLRSTRSVFHFEGDVPDNAQGALRTMHHRRTSSGVIDLVLGPRAEKNPRRMFQ